MELLEAQILQYFLNPQMTAKFWCRILLILAPLVIVTRENMSFCLFFLRLKLWAKIYKLQLTL